MGPVGPRSDTADAAEFERHRAHLHGAAYRITGSRADAEDAVQEAWLRFARLTAAEQAQLRDVRAWLSTTVGRLCLDRLRSAAARRERPAGSWLPEPLVTELAGAPDPLDTVVRDEGLRMAALVVLERLRPEQRVALVLHDALAVPFTEIAGVLGCSAPAARQHASRARRAVADADPAPRAARAEHLRVLDAFLAALASGDVHAVTALLHPDVVVIGDGGGVQRTAQRPIVGADKVSRFLLGLLGQYGPEMLRQVRPVLVNGDPGFAVPAVAGRRSTGRRVAAIAVRDGRVVAVYDIADPAKLPSVTEPAGGTPPRT